MKFYRNNWYYIGGILFVVLSFFIGLFGRDIDPLRIVLTLSFMALLVHQFEEYALPGGFPAVWNIVASGEKESPNRYPLNKQSSLVANTFMAYLLYILAIIFKEWYWLGLITMFIGFAQLIMHGIIIPKKFKTFYNPGLASTIFLQVPVSIYYIWYLQVNYSIPTWNWWVAIIGLPITAFLTLIAPISIYKDKHSPYPFSKEEMQRFSVQEKLQKKI